MDEPQFFGISVTTQAFNSFVMAVVVIAVILMSLAVSKFISFARKNKSRKHAHQEFLFVVRLLLTATLVLVASFMLVVETLKMNGIDLVSINIRGTNK